MNKHILWFCISCCLILMVGCASYSQGRQELSNKNNSVAVERQTANNYDRAEKDSDGGGGGGGGGGG